MPEDTKEIQVQDYVPTIVDLDWLRYRCHQSIEDFEKEAGFVTHETPTGTYMFKDNGAKILAVAHRDVVERVAKSRTFYLKGNLVYAPQLDDRLGIHLILDILHLHGLNYDILLTEGEETGQSTARYFTAPEGKKYNWMFEIDRMGLQTVMYDFHSYEKKKMLEDEYSLQVGHGSFTDICLLDDLGCWGVNFACAYYAQHTEQSYMNVYQLENLLLPNIIKFIREKQDTFFEHKKVQRYITVCRTTTTTKATDTKPYPVRTQQEVSKRWERFTWSHSYECFICNDCGRAYRNCTGVECEYKTEDGVRVCQICNIAGCIGYEKCACCGFHYHRSKCLQHTGYCQECLIDIFGVEPGTLANLFSLTPAIVTSALTKIELIIGNVSNKDDKDESQEAIVQVV